MKKEMPVIFIGHGSPENALESNKFNKQWEKLAKAIPKPKLILCISAHWVTEGSAITAMEKPRTIHDFYGFEKELYSIKYSAKGSKQYAEKIKKIVKKVSIDLDTEWGLDHGSWSVLIKMYPKADIPVLQMSLGYGLTLEKAFEIGKELSVLRSEGVLIMGSGNLVHNLSMMDFSVKPYTWAIDFDNFVKENISKGNYKNLIEYGQNKSSQMAHPTNEHYQPLIYVLGSALNDKAWFFNEEIIYGSVGMRCVVFGMKKPEGF